MASTSYTKYNSPQIFSKLIIQFWTVLEFQSMGRSGTMKIYIQLLLVMLPPPHLSVNLHFLNILLLVLCCNLYHAKRLMFHCILEQY
ncbi:uncharacterized protein LOC116022898 isoform X2 [Ipomoea triloba]|uniref:uncharacterized protein LOC116022898 isoform X2 n=1 Tax=Ipomoea triloba TaxID=35885 RepID=UPI00125E0904|nr:uncharacterized protein LOC116022898 isoform X2 [Ipomoea triloba]